MNKIKSPKVFVVVLNYNGIDVLNNCLTSVFKSNYKNFEVVVVDNDSSDGSLEKAKANFSRAHFIKNSANVGFAQGNNIGIRFALEKFADFVFVLNNDTIIYEDTITSLVKSFSGSNDIGIISPLILNNDNSVWFAGGKILWKKMRNIHVLSSEKNSAYESEFISGCAMMIKKDVFKKIGLFDERFFLYYEDADFSLRTAKSGFKLLVLPTLKIIHLEKSNTSNAKTYWLVLSGLIFFFTHATITQKLYLFPYFQIRKIKNLFDIFHGNNKASKEVRRAYLNYKKARKIK